MEDIIACKQTEKEVRLSTDPYRKIKQEKIMEYLWKAVDMANWKLPVWVVAMIVVGAIIVF